MGIVAVLLALAASLAFGSSAVAGHEGQNHCITPVGDDLNAIFRTRDAFVAPFCTEVPAGDRWRAVLRVQVADSDVVFPAGYAPSRFPLDQDFLAKFVSGRYVVDAGTRNERSYTFTKKRHLIQVGALPDGTRFARWVTPSLRPLRPGPHVVDEYVTQTADFWDGLGLDPAVNFAPAGESQVGSVAVEVVRRRR